MKQKLTEEFQNGKILLFNKPYTWTSFDLVKKVRWQIRKNLDINKIKVGHAGTLDPLATGLLIICTGKFTKRITEIQDAEKQYEAVFYLGKTTPSFDLETSVDNEYATDHITENMINQVADGFIGAQMQVPPLFSAKQIDGERAYDIARSGKTADLRTVPIEILSFDILKIEMPLIHARICCSKGTYIRAIARDLGERLQCGAYLSALKRTAIGTYMIEDAIEVSDFESWISQVSVLSSE
ncbi:MAG: tRNA pseudouridine(55) synthase TruB [Bacteroidetes bacterium]|nr:tRNA pseudouridine(55) synthase TruB [Bacteroidota bacterium]MBU1719330.1 tRNA pseudouridine(55) synthase TruB [Bacteroidota bacterium]